MHWTKNGGMHYFSDFLYRKRSKWPCLNRRHAWEMELKGWLKRVVRRDAGLPVHSIEGALLIRSGRRTGQKGGTGAATLTAYGAARHHRNQALTYSALLSESKHALQGTALHPTLPS